MLASMPDDSPFFKLGPRAVTPTAEFGNRADILMADIPAGGKMSARAMARMYASLLGEVDGVRLVSPERLREISAGAFSGMDQIMGFPSHLGAGVLRRAVSRATRNSLRACWAWGASAGASPTPTPHTGVAFALTKNHLTADFGAAAQIDGIVKQAVSES